MRREGPMPVAGADFDENELPHASAFAGHILPVGGYRIQHVGILEVLLRDDWPSQLDLRSRLHGCNLVVDVALPHAQCVCPRLAHVGFVAEQPLRDDQAHKVDHQSVSYHWSAAIRLVSQERRQMLVVPVVQCISSLIFGFGGKLRVLARKRVPIGTHCARRRCWWHCPNRAFRRGSLRAARQATCVHKTLHPISELNRTKLRPDLTCCEVPHAPPAVRFKRMLDHLIVATVCADVRASDACR
mmetsp:Transcript_82713/g.267827  ORF Transcript_82713/g.267827 Transcript_82713/m.267827 type:complete len:243 (+) Transcript_82713:950-1678(+)